MLLGDVDTLPSFCSARVLILGVGNLLFSEDGFGPAVVDYLNENSVIPDDVYVMVVGTGVRKLLSTLTLSQVQPEEIVIVDAVDWGQSIGKVIEIPVERLPPTKIDDFSLHQVRTSNLLHELQDRSGIRVRVVACDVGEIPQIIKPGLSPPTLQAVMAAGLLIADRYPFDRSKLSLHDLSITQSPFNLALRCAGEAGVSRIHAIHLKIKERLSRIADSAQLYWVNDSDSRIAAGARLHFYSQVPMTSPTPRYPGGLQVRSRHDYPRPHRRTHPLSKRSNSRPDPQIAR